MTGMPLDASHLLSGDVSYLHDSASDPEHRQPSGSLQRKPTVSTTDLTERLIVSSVASATSLVDGSSVSPSPPMSTLPYDTDLIHTGPFYPNYSMADAGDMFTFQNTPFPDAFATNTYDFSGSHSPVSASSVNMWSQYSDTRRGSRNLFTPTTTDSVSPFNTPYAGTAQNEYVDSSANYYEAQDKCEETIITKELGNVINVQDNHGFQPHLTNLDSRYLDAYWRFFDPLFSIINPSTFEASGVSPLVKALMVAIGAYHFDDHAAQMIALTLRETCAKLLHDRLVLDYQHSRLWDLQATFLFEAFSVYCSRRPHSRFSQRFEELVQDLRSDRDNAFYSTPLSVVDAGAANLCGVTENTRQVQWVHLESKRRLLLACYVLEIQQNILFGSHRPVSDKNLPMPCSRGLWEAKHFEQWQYLVEQETADSRPFSEAMAAYYSGEASLFDGFLYNLAVTHATDNAMSDPSNTRQMFPPSAVPSPASVFAVESACLAIHTPVQHLLAVSGETFVLGQKLTTRDQFHEAYGELQAWLTSGRAVPAIQSALRLFSMSLHGERIGLIYEDWVVTLAALVFWACTMWPQQGHTQGQLSQLPTHGMTELVTKIIGTAMQQPEQAWREGQGIGWNSARACLAYARQRIDGRIGWLAQDASGVLGKLIEGRVVDDTEDTA